MNRNALGLREVLVAVALGLFCGICGLFGWDETTPEAIGFYVFCAAIIGAGMRRKR